MSKLTLTIAIPCYNESTHIVPLLLALLKQSTVHYSLSQILVYSDGSTDETTTRVRSLSSPLIHLISAKTRQGKPHALNQLFKQSQTDLVVLLDADLTLTGDEVIDHLVAPFIHDKELGLSSGLARHTHPLNFVERLAYASNAIWERAITYPAEKALYYCSGSVRAFSRPFYKQIHFPSFSADDAFAYLACVKAGYHFAVVDDLSITQKLPTTLTDLISQSTRFIQSETIQDQVFAPSFVAPYYSVKPIHKLKALLWYLPLDPLATFAYLGFRAWIAWTPHLRHASPTALWQIASSTKELSTPTIIFSNYDDQNNPHYGGGGAIAIHAIAKRLAKVYSLTVITGTYPGATNTLVDGVKYLRIGTSALGSQMGQLIYQLILPYYARTMRYDLWFDSLTPPVSLGLIPLFAKSPVVGLVHMLPGLDMQRKYYLPFHVLERLTLKSYQTLVATTEAIKSQLTHLNHVAKIIVIKNGIELVSPKLKKSSHHILYLGRLEINQKGLDLLLSAYRLLQTHLKLPLILAGSGTKFEELKLHHLIQKNHLSSSVKLVGKVAGSAKSSLLLNAAVIVVPSRFETFSLVALEAMSFGVPLVTFDLAGLSWIPRDLRFVASALTPQTLAESIQAALRAKPSVTSRAQIFAQSYNWEVPAKQYDSLIRGLLS